MGRKIINISVPEALHSFVETRVLTGEYSSVSEYFRELIKLDKHRERLRYEEARRADAMRPRPYENRRY